MEEFLLSDSAMEYVLNNLSCENVSFLSPRIHFSTPGAVYKLRATPVTDAGRVPEASMSRFASRFAWFQYTNEPGCEALDQLPPPELHLRTIRHDAVGK